MVGMGSVGGNVAAGWILGRAWESYLMKLDTNPVMTKVWVLSVWCSVVDSGGRGLMMYFFVFTGGVSGGGGGPVFMVDIRRYLRGFCLW